MTDDPGHRILEMTARLGIDVANIDNAITFKRAGHGKLITEITFTLPLHIFDWRVVENYTGNDHQYLTYRVSRNQVTRRIPTTPDSLWNVAKLNEKA